MIEENHQQQQHLEQEEKLLKDVPHHILERVLGGYLTGTRFIYDQKYEIAIGCLTTAIGLIPLAYLFRLRGIAFLNHKLLNKCINDCDFYCNYHINANTESNKKYLIDGLLIRIHANILLQKYRKAHEDVQQLDEISKKYKISLENNEKLNEDVEMMKDNDNINDLEIFIQVFGSLLAASEKQKSEKTRLEIQNLVSKLCLFCEKYEKMIIQSEFKWISTYHAKDLECINLDRPLSISDIGILANSCDSNARSMGAVLLSDKFEEFSLKFDENLYHEIVEAGGIDALVTSLLEWKDPEVKFFATKAISDLCWSANANIRWKLIESNILAQLINQLNSDDIDLVGISVSAMALLGRGVTKIQNLIREQGGLDALFKLVNEKKANHQILIYIVQALAWLSVDIENKIYIAKEKQIIIALGKIMRITTNKRLIELIIIVIGNVCQNPKMWGRFDFYDHMNSLVKQLVQDNVFSVIIKYALEETDILNPEAMELKVNSIITLKQLLAFKVIHDRVESLGGERLFMEQQAISSNSMLLELLSNAATLYRTLQDYGDHMHDAPWPRFRLTMPSLKEIDAPSTHAIKYPSKEQVNPSAASETTSKKQNASYTSQKQEPNEDDLLNMFEMRIMKDKGQGINKKSGSTPDPISKFVNGIFDMTSYMWDGDEQKESKQSKTKLRNQKKKLKRAANKKAAKLEQQKRHADEQQEKLVSEIKKETVIPKKKEKSLQHKDSVKQAQVPQATSVDNSKTKKAIKQEENSTLVYSELLAKSDRISEETSSSDSTMEREEHDGFENYSQRVCNTTDPYITFLQEFEVGMNMLARSFNWGI